MKTILIHTIFYGLKNLENKQIWKRKKYLASKFESFEEPEVAEWLQRCRTINAAQESKKAAKIAIWSLTAALIAAAGGIVSALTNLWSLFPK